MNRENAQRYDDFQRLTRSQNEILNEAEALLWMGSNSSSLETEALDFQTGSLSENNLNDKQGDRYVERSEVRWTACNAIVHVLAADTQIIAVRNVRQCALFPSPPKPLKCCHRSLLAFDHA